MSYHEELYSVEWNDEERCWHVWRDNVLLGTARTNEEAWDMAADHAASRAEYLCEEER